MLIQQIGHAEFLIETEEGARLVIDPYDAACGYPVRKLQADTALISHGHHDHNAVENLEGLLNVIDRPGIHTPAKGVRVTALQSWHDDCRGSKRGETLLFLIEAEGLRIVHLGDLGCIPDPEQIRILDRPDVLMIPCGGFYTIDGKNAAKIAGMLGAKVIMPMHYRTEYISDWPISGPEEFLEGIPETDIRRDAEVLRITDRDLECQPKVVLFKA